jgi:hypothetical protein
VKDAHPSQKTKTKNLLQEIFCFRFLFSGGEGNHRGADGVDMEREEGGAGQERGGNRQTTKRA